MLGLLALVSFFIGMDYVMNGSVNSGFGIQEEFCCLSVAFILMIIVVGGTGFNVFNAVSVSRRTKSKTSLRALYIFIFYPILAVSFVIPSIDDLFITSMIFGLPVFLLGMILLPFATFTLMREAFKISKKEYVVSSCTYCNFPFRRESETTEGMCPRCGAYNSFTPGQADNVNRPQSQEAVHRAVPLEGSPGAQTDQYGMEWDQQQYGQGGGQTGGEAYDPKSGQTGGEAYDPGSGQTGADSYNPNDRRW